MHLKLSVEASNLASKALQTRDLKMLDNAIKIMELAIDMAGSHVQPVTLSSYGGMVGLRYTMTKSMDDLDRAIEITTKATSGILQGSPLQASTLGNLHNFLDMRLQRTNSGVDLDRAIDSATAVLNATLPQHVDGGVSDLGLGSSVRDKISDNLQRRLIKRFNLTGSMDDVNHPVELATIAANSLPPGPGQADRLDELGQYLWERFEQTSSIQDLDQAIDVLNTAIHSATPEWSPNRNSMLVRLEGFLFE